MRARHTMLNMHQQHEDVDTHKINTHNATSGQIAPICTMQQLYHKKKTIRIGINLQHAIVVPNTKQTTIACMRQVSNCIVQKMYQTSTTTGMRTTTTHIKKQSTNNHVCMMQSRTLQKHKMVQHRCPQSTWNANDRRTHHHCAKKTCPQQTANKSIKQIKMRQRQPPTPPTSADKSKCATPTPQTQTNQNAKTLVTTKIIQHQRVDHQNAKHHWARTQANQHN